MVSEPRWMQCRDDCGWHSDAGPADIAVPSILAVAKAVGPSDKRLEKAIHDWAHNHGRDLYPLVVALIDYVQRTDAIYERFDPDGEIWKAFAREAPGNIERVDPVTGLVECRDLHCGLIDRTLIHVGH